MKQGKVINRMYNLNIEYCILNSVRRSRNEHTNKTDNWCE